MRRARPSTGSASLYRCLVLPFLPAALGLIGPSLICLIPVLKPLPGENDLEQRSTMALCGARRNQKEPAEIYCWLGRSGAQRRRLVDRASSFRLLTRNATDSLTCPPSSWQTSATLETAGGVHVSTVLSAGGRLRYLTKRSSHSLSEGIKLLLS